MRQGRGEFEPPEHLPAIGAIEAEQVPEAAVDRAEPEQAGGQNREEGDQRGQDEQGGPGIVEPGPQDHQGRYGHHRRHLDHHRIGHQRAFGQARLGEQDGQRHAGQAGQQKGAERDLEGEDQTIEQRREIRDQADGDGAGGRQDEDRHVENAHRDLPGGEREQADQRRQQNAPKFAHDAPLSPSSTSPHQAAYRASARKAGRRG